MTKKKPGELGLLAKTYLPNCQTVEMVERLARSSVKSFDPIASVDEFIEKELLPQNLTPRERFDELADKFDALDDLYR